LIAGLFILFRRIERWLHQHIFKVGWLLTHNFQTTTILYYTFFLPGVILHEVVYWLTAGLMNVRADRAIKWPEAQEIGELKLNFVQLDRRTGSLKRAVITAAPLLAGVLVIWWITTSRLNIPAVMDTLSTGELTDVGQGFNQLLGAPDFWLWFYIVFAIANTMFPAIPKDLRGWRSVVGAVAVAALLSIIVGIGNDLLSTLLPSVSASLQAIEGTLALIISVNILAVLFLGTVESIIERVTGHSATFRRGKMITMTREEAIQTRLRERERQQRQRERQRKAEERRPVSIYTLSFPVPGPPGDEPVTQKQARLLDIDDEGQIRKRTEALPSSRSPRIGADLITRQKSTTPSTEANVAEASAAADDLAENEHPLDSHSPLTRQARPELPERTQTEVSIPAESENTRPLPDSRKSDDEDEDEDESMMNRRRDQSDDAINAIDDLFDQL